MVAKHNNKNKSFIASTIITFVIIALLIISGPAQAVLVNIIATDLNNRQVGETGFFYVNVTIGANEKIPLANISVEGLPKIDGSPNGTLLFNISDLNNISDSLQIGNYGISLINRNGWGSDAFGYGYGQGYGYNYGYAPFYGYGYGYQFYGYGYGYGYRYVSAPETFYTELDYKITVNTAGAEAKTYAVAVKVNAGYDITGNFVTFSSESTDFTLLPATTTPPSPGGGSDSGSVGGGITTSEPIDNIAKAETVEKYLLKDQTVTFSFPTIGQCTYEIVATGNENETNVAVRVEELKSTSKLVTESAPGEVYKNFNVWTGSKRIKEALLKCKVENSWMDSNGISSGDVKIQRWSDNKWVQLDTAQTKKDSTDTYYEANAPGFSSFAVSGLKAVAVTTPEVKVTTPAITPTVKATLPATVPPPSTAAPVNLAIIIGTLVLIIAIVALYLWKR